LQREMPITGITDICKFLQLYVNSYNSEKEAKGMKKIFHGRDEDAEKAKPLFSNRKRQYAGTPEKILSAGGHLREPGLTCKILQLYVSFYIYL